MLRGQAKGVRVKEEAETEDVEYITSRQNEMVWHKDIGGCASWVNPLHLLEGANDSIMMKRLDGMICFFRISKLNSGCELFSRFGGILISRYLHTKNYIYILTSEQ